MPRFTLYGAYKYEDRLFDGIVLPSGMDMEAWEHGLLASRGQLYPYQQQPHILKTSILLWGSRRKAAWEHMYAALTAAYSPIENYDRIEDRDYQERGSDTDTTALGNSTTVSDNTTSTTTPADTTTTDLSVSAFDSTSQVPREKTVSTRGGTISTQNGGSVTTQSGGSDTLTKEYGRGTKETLHAHGNIGVTTNQQMIEAELSLRRDYDIYEMIWKEFEEEFLVQVY